MLKKSLRYCSLLSFITIILFSCKKNDNATIEDDNEKCIVETIENIKIDSFSYKRLENKLFVKCNFTREDIGFSYINNVIFENCLFNINVQFRILNGRNIKFINCTFNNLGINNSKIINKLCFENCKINELNIIETEFNDLNISSFNDSINFVKVQNSPKSSILNLVGLINNVRIEGGEINKLDVSNITNPKTKLVVFSTELINPNFVNKSSKNYEVLFNSSLENATFYSNANSILKEELEWQDKNTKLSTETERKEIKKGYLVSKSVYSYLSKIFEADKKYSLADYFYFRAKICEREINSEGSSKTFQRIFNENIRGDYGTNYLTILNTFLYITILFSILYFILGYFKFAFGYYVKTKLLGETSENEKPVLLTYHRNKFGFIVFITNCFIFSLNNMVLGGLNNGFHFYNFTTMYLFPPRKYGTIGIGRLFSIMQSLIGLVLVFFFITSFLRLTR